ncbi:diguanylate cyclase (GGDEF) domain-containing protein [Devosia sp. YR412]|uniref:sensor domain-containing diguanylate cyclase n=1 Tax=Devosia sp. YR412 TaxID=1881030 RepID=UPI0008CEA0F3|nr:sensor domain-containing diguanylate cyclase [Devosia sp. YR412]SEQ61533.1 diguanylate cyclase (GGDEF) domain-containing protein [Devosia sp. YR412]
MSSLIDNPAWGPSARSDLRPRLQRFCDLLGIAGARLAQLDGARLDLLASAGSTASNLAQLDAATIIAGQTTIIADTHALGLSPACFYVGLLIPGTDAHRPYLLTLFDHRPRSANMAAHLASLAQEAVAQTMIERQRREIEQQKQTIADYAAVEEHRRDLFDRASATARIGIWQCNLADESLLWTNGVYDLFEIERNSVVTRQSTMALYTDTSRRQMEAARAAAIADCTDFSVDCEIITVTGKRRWMRLTGAVESRDGVAYRIFGMKQDITEEKLMTDRTRYLAEYDVMTGLANRSQFQTRLSLLDEGREVFGAMLLIDLDGFKQVNDTYGHALGDECLKEAAQRLVENCGDAQLVARIGGDEFAVLLPAEMVAADVQALAQRIVERIGRPFMRKGQRLTMGASVGVAQYRGGSSENLFRQADIALYAAKAAGRNTSRSYLADAA